MMGGIEARIMSFLRDIRRIVRRSCSALRAGGKCGLLGVMMVLVVAAPVVEGASVYKVKKGDTFYSIARAHGTTHTKLMALNGIKDPRKLRIGQRLKLSGSSSSGKSSSSTTKSSSKVSRVGAGKRVVIDPGHGGRDKGAIRSGVRESDLNMRVAKKLEANLKARGYSTVMTRRSDTFVSLTRRAMIANSYRNAIFVSIHFNATRETWVRGAETYYAGSAGRSLASSIQRQLVSRLRLRNRGVRMARFTVLMQTNCPAVLVECGFISNASERKRCTTSSYQTSAALAIADGIKNYRWR
jgi:N-acetylmuramoyl-L-alanine amidase